MMWFLWQFMTFGLVPLPLTAVQPIDFKELITDADLFSKQSSPQQDEQATSKQSNRERLMKEQEQLTVALLVFQELLWFHQTTGNIADAATAWFRLGDIYQQINQFSQALSSYQQAIAHYQIVGDAMGEVNALSHLGKAYENQGWFNSALEYYDQALTKIRQNSDCLEDATTLSRLATCIEDMF